MDRMRRVAELWNWLPAFRAVGEYRNIHKAAAALHVSPSALSRSVKLLEENVGEPLFVRSATGLQPTAVGDQLLVATRDAMRRVDDALSEELSSRTGTQTFTVAASGPVLPALAALALSRVVRAEQSPPMHRLVDLDEQLFIGELLRGNVDVVLAHEPPQGDGAEHLTCVPIGDLLLAVHALAAGSKCDTPARSIALDGTAVDSSVAIVAPSIDTAACLARATGLTVRLPTVLAPDGLRVVGRPISRMPVQAIHRRALGEPHREVTALVEALRNVLDEREDRNGR